MRFDFTSTTFCQVTQLFFRLYNLVSTKQSGSVQFVETLEHLFLRFHFQNLRIVPIEQLHYILFFITPLLRYLGHLSNTKRWSQKQADAYIRVLSAV